MLQQIWLSTIFIIVGASSFACQTSPAATNIEAEQAVSVENNSAVNVPANAAFKNPENDDDAAFSLATPQETLKAYYAALRKNDDQLFRRTLSKRAARAINVFEERGRLVDGVRRAMESTRQSLEMPEVESETIDADKAVLTFKKGRGGRLELVKEKREWKMYTTTVEP